MVPMSRSSHQLLHPHLHPPPSGWVESWSQMFQAPLYAWRHLNYCQSEKHRYSTMPT
jgi:hypothetical protein